MFPQYVKLTLSRPSAEFFQRGIAVVLLGLPERNTQGLPFAAAKRFCQIDDLPDVIAGVRQQSMKRFMNLKMDSANGDRPQEIGVA